MDYFCLFHNFIEKELYGMCYLGEAYFVQDIVFEIYKCFLLVVCFFLLISNISLNEYTSLFILPLMDT